MDNGYIPLVEFARQVDYTKEGIKNRIKNGKIKKFKKAKAENGVIGYFIHESELANYKTEKSQQPEPQLGLNIENGNSEWLSVSDFLRESGRSRTSTHYLIKSGKIKNIKKEKNSRGNTDKLLIHKSEVEQFKMAPSTRKVGPRFSSTPRFGDLPKVNEDVDVTLDLISDFVPETGKYPYKNLCKAVALAIQRRSWEDIDDETGVPKKHIVVLIEEYKEAGKKEPKKFPTLMSYLNAGRPYATRNRNYAEGGE